MTKCFPTNRGKDFCIVVSAGGESYTIESDEQIIVKWNVERDGVDVFIHELLHAVGLNEEGVRDVSNFLKTFVKIAC